MIFYIWQHLVQWPPGPLAGQEALSGDDKKSRQPHTHTRECTALPRSGRGRNIFRAYGKREKQRWSGSQAAGESFSRLGRAVKGVGKTCTSFLGREPPVKGGHRQATGVNRRQIWACRLDRLRLQMAEKEEKER